MKKEQIAKIIQANNLAFKKATKPQKRVMIAQDVLAQIKAKKFRAKEGTWVSPSRNLGYGTEGVREAFAAGEMGHCNVCALGGLFMSCTNLNGGTTFNDFDSEADEIGYLIEMKNTLSNGLDKFFSYDQLRLIEIYFEGGEGAFQLDELPEDIDADSVISFWENYGATDRLKMIMENIVQNKGTFKPKKLL